MLIFEIIILYTSVDPYEWKFIVYLVQSMHSSTILFVSSVSGEMVDFHNDRPARHQDVRKTVGEDLR